MAVAFLEQGWPTAWKTRRKPKMSVKVLKSKVEIAKARRELRRRGLSFTSSGWKHLAHKLGLSGGIDLGDELKSWDVLRTVEFIESNVSKDAPILDIGAFACELPCILNGLHYSNLAGIDLDPNVKKMPYAGAIRYEISDFTSTPFESESFQAITAISAIEHGLNSERLLKEITRLLRPGGFFIASFDYWPDKVDTSGIKIFGMDWRIFSKQEVSAFLNEASEFKLFPHGELDFLSSEKAIHCARRHYTFAWLALQKAVSVRHDPDEVAGSALAH